MTDEIDSDAVSKGTYGSLEIDVDGYMTCLCQV